MEPDDLVSFHADVQAAAEACDLGGDPDAPACVELAELRRAILDEIAKRAARR